MYLAFEPWYFDYQEYGPEVNVNLLCSLPGQRSQGTSDFAGYLL